MNETELHNYLLKRCVELSIRELEGIQLDKVLYVELLNVMKGRSRTLFRSLIKMLVKTIGFTPDVDFRAVLDFKPDEFVEWRMGFAENLAEKLFILQTLAPDNMNRATYVAGKKVFDRLRTGSRFMYAADIR